MLEFYYDFVDYFADRSDFQYCMMDIDPAYLAISDDLLEDVVKPELKEEFQGSNYRWLGRDDTEENVLYDNQSGAPRRCPYSISV